MNVLTPENSLLLIIDVQEKLVNALDKDIIVKRVSNLVKSARLLNIPVVATEQYPKGLGATVETVSAEFAENTPVFEKTSFNALEADGVLEKIKAFNKKQIVICGIETHICVHQTAAALLREGYEVYVIKDACASRSKYEFKQGIELMASNGVKVSCVEIVLFEWLKTAKNPCFKEIQALIK
ncbi:isochorismatase family protein [bacterium]|nr:isochorismatase family protein [bacterium]